VLDRAVKLKNMLKNRVRVRKIASFVANHFTEFVEPMGYKAFLVAVDREACCLYKEALDRHLPKEKTCVVMSRGSDDPAHLRRYHVSENEEKRIRKAFKKPDENPRILVVTEKLLTGYDAPILYAMYLDKPMRDHVLLQAIARVNRPYEGETQRKTNGLIVDFVGVFDNLERALAFDSRDVAGVVEGLDVLKEHFVELMEEGRSRYLPLIDGRSDDKAAENVLEHFRDKEERENFYSFFRELEETYEILSPDRFLRPYLTDYRRLVDMYKLLRSAYEPHVAVDKSFLRKTAEIVQKHTTTEMIKTPDRRYEIGSQALLALLEEDKPETVKVFNLLKELYRLVEARGRDQLYLIPIGDRAEAIRRAFEERQIQSHQAIQEIEQLVKQLREAEEERKGSKLSSQAFAVAWWLRVQEGFGARESEEIARRIDVCFRELPHWATSERQERELRTRLYKIFLDATDDVVSLVGRVLDMLRRME